MDIFRSKDEHSPMNRHESGAIVSSSPSPGNFGRCTLTTCMNMRFTPINNWLSKSISINIRKWSYVLNKLKGKNDSEKCEKNWLINPAFRRFIADYVLYFGLFEYRRLTGHCTKKKINIYSTSNKKISENRTQRKSRKFIDRIRFTFHRFSLQDLKEVLNITVIINIFKNLI